MQLKARVRWWPSNTSSEQSARQKQSQGIQTELLLIKHIFIHLFLQSDYSTDKERKRKQKPFQAMMEQVFCQHLKTLPSKWAMIMVLEIQFLLSISGRAWKKIDNNSKIVKTIMLNSHNYVSILCYVKWACCQLWNYENLGRYKRQKNKTWWFSTWNMFMLSLILVANILIS